MSQKYPIGFPEYLKGKFIEAGEISRKCDDLVRFAIANQWDRELLLQWVMVAWDSATKETGSHYRIPWIPDVEGMIRHPSRRE